MSPDTLCVIFKFTYSLAPLPHKRWYQEPMSDLCLTWEKVGGAAILLTAFHGRPILVSASVLAFTFTVSGTIFTMTTKFSWIYPHFG